MIDPLLKPKDQKRSLRLRLPVKVFDDGREVCDRKTSAGRREYKTRKLEMWVRQKYRCRICFKPLAAEGSQFDHENSRHPQDDRIVVDGRWQNGAVHEFCNQQKGSTRGYPEWPWPEGGVNA